LIFSKELVEIEKLNTSDSPPQTPPQSDSVSTEPHTTAEVTTGVVSLESESSLENAVAPPVDTPFLSTFANRVIDIATINDGVDVQW
jgi:hypothetical protein